jgi:hypothetical protein
MTYTCTPDERWLPQLRLSHQEGSTWCSCRLTMCLPSTRPVDKGQLGQGSSGRNQAAQLQRAANKTAAIALQQRRVADGYVQPAPPIPPKATVGLLKGIRQSCSPQAEGEVAPVTLFVVNPAGQGTANSTAGSSNKTACSEFKDTPRW